MRTKVACLLVGIAICIFIGVRITALAGTTSAILVTTLEDELNLDGDCSLREAVQAANTDIGVDACPAGEPGSLDTITFGLPGTIVLTSQLDIAPGGSLLVDGGDTVVLSGGNSVRIAHVEDGASLTLQGLAIKDGYAYYGAGILNSGALTLTNTTLSGNQALNYGGAIYNKSVLTITGSNLSSNQAYYGGAVYNTGILTFTHGTISDNFTAGETYSATQGGAVYNDCGQVTISYSTLSGNSAAKGGGILNQHGTLIIVNSTLSGNQASPSFGGGVFNLGDLSLYSSTITSNSSIVGGGLYSLGAVMLRNTILAGNSATYSSPDCSGSILSLGYNLVGDKGSCGFILTTGDLTGVSAVLGSLLDNGGPTQTHAILSGSMAVDMGSPGDCADHLGNPLLTDQRGIPRSGRCDIGAFERQPETLPLYPNVVYIPVLNYLYAPISYADDFSDPNSGWPILDVPNARVEYLDDEYRILIKNSNTWAGANPGLNAIDYYVDVSARQVSSSVGTYGILFGLSSDFSQFYTFEITSDGHYAVWRKQLDDWTLLAKGYSDIILQGTTENQLRIEHFNARILVYANGQLLNLIQDGAIPASGYAGLIVTSQDEINVDIRFDNFTAHPGPGVLPGTLLADELKAENLTVMEFEPTR